MNLRLMRLIDDQHLKTPFYGARQMARHLRRQGYTVSRKRIRRLMTKTGLAAVYQRPRTRAIFTVRRWGQNWTPITPERGSKLHAGSHARAPLELLPATPMVYRCLAVLSGCRRSCLLGDLHVGGASVYRLRHRDQRVPLVSRRRSRRRQWLRSSGIPHSLSRTPLPRLAGSLAAAGSTLQAIPPHFDLGA